MPADCVLHSPLAEFSVSADNGGLMFRGSHGQFIILGARQASRTCCPASVARLPQHVPYCGIDVVIEEEPH